MKVEKINLDFTFKDIRTKALEEETESKKEEPGAGGEISVDISLTYFPDYKEENAGEQLIAYLNSGSESGIKNIIRDLIEEDIREMGRKFDWELFTFSAGEIRELLVEKLTERKLTKDVEQELRTNGFSDVVNLGIRINRFNVGKVKEQGELARAAESFAKERQERKGEKIELEFVQKQTQEFIDLGMSPREAVDTVQTERGKAVKQVTSIHGVESVGGAVAAGIASMLGGSGGKKPTQERAPSETEPSPERKEGEKKTVPERVQRGKELISKYKKKYQ